MNPSDMASTKATFGHDEIARLAYLNWEADGRPHGRDQHYWLEAEAQIKATWHMIATARSATRAAKAVEETRLKEVAVSLSVPQSEKNSAPKKKRDRLQTKLGEEERSSGQGGISRRRKTSNVRAG